MKLKLFSFGGWLWALFCFWMPELSPSLLALRGAGLKSNLMSCWLPASSTSTIFSESSESSISMTLFELNNGPCGVSSGAISCFCFCCSSGVFTGGFITDVSVRTVVFGFWNPGNFGGSTMTVFVCCMMTGCCPVCWKMEPSNGMSCATKKRSISLFLPAKSDGNRWLPSCMKSDACFVTTCMQKLSSFLNEIWHLEQRTVFVISPGFFSMARFSRKSGFRSWSAMMWSTTLSKSVNSCWQNGHQSALMRGTKMELSSSSPLSFLLELKL